ncbi:MAG TPA: YceI family protein [Aequorivita sp.]|nr:YceI family protein [Aequorivita sp.]
MKSTTLKITLLAFLAVGAFSCKNNETKTEEPLEVAAEASDLATSYVVDTEKSIIKWEGSKPTTTHFGTVNVFSGTLLAAGDKIEAGNFTIDMKSIVVQDIDGDERAMLEAHLKGTTEGKEGDFFDTNTYPHAKFEMTGIENDIVKGNLTIKDKTHAIEFPAKIIIEGDAMTLETEQIELDRTKWGVNFGSKSIFPNLGDKFVSDTMKVTISLVAVKA